MGSIHSSTLKAVGLFLFLFVCVSLPLNQAHAYPAPKFKQVLLCSVQGANGSIYTLFYAIISGPSPEDVASFTATGPSGTFTITANRSWKEKGLYYAYGYSEGTGIVDSGAYTFQVTDSLGRSATEVRNFTYNGTLPQVNPATMIPADGAYVGTTTPTLSFNPVEGSVYYDVKIEDYDSKAIWWSSGISTATSFTVPSGLLQPNTAYRWYARVWDAETNPQNLQESNPFSFYTGTKADPEFTGGGVISIPVGENLLNYAYASSINVAPWDIDYFRGTGPDSTVINLKGARNYGFQFSVSNGLGFYLDPPTQSIPDGTYTVEIADNSGHTVTRSSNYAYNPVPDFSADSRIPANNAYFNTDTPSFSWARVIGDPGDGSYRYSVRIVDYANRIRWYDSPYSANTSFTLPAGLNLPRGSSYKWRVNLYGPAGSGGTNSNNYRMSDYRTFTINGPASFVNKDDSTCGGKSPCYTSIQSAIDGADTGDDIRIAQGTYTEEINLNQSKSLRLQGGWDTSFENQTGTTILRQAPKAPQGSLTLQDLSIKPNEPAVYTTNSLGQTFVLLPASTFTMGSPWNESGRYDDEGPQHQVTLTQPFYMQTTEVTQSQWEAVMGSNPSYFSGCPTCPVDRVSWNDIQLFLGYMNARGEGTYGLPTEAQWEYAARAGSTTAFYNGGITELGCGYDPNLDAIGWYCYNSYYITHPAAGKAPNAWDLYDMSGNVWEWCSDWYGFDYYSNSPTDNPQGPSSGSTRVIRGGSYNDGAQYSRSAYRGNITPDIRSGIGFRLALSLGQQ